MAKKNYYAVKVGLRTGIFKTWEECSSCVQGYPGAKYKGFATLAEAEGYIEGSVVVTKKKSTRTTIDQNNKTYKVDSGKFNSETQNYYVVRCGRTIGVFNTWKECEEQVKGYQKAEYKKVIDKKIKALEISIEQDNNEVLKLERSKNTIDSDKLEIENKIKEIKKELKVLDTTELTREQLMDKIKFIKIDKGNKFIVEYC